MRASRSLHAFVVPGAVFAVLAAVTLLVWRGQVAYQRSLLLHHSEDICAQASRRLQVFVESHLRVAAIFARRWSEHETRDFSRQRFREFAAVLVDELPGYQAVALVQPDLSSGWSVPEGSRVVEAVLRPERRSILAQARHRRGAVLSAPSDRAGDVHFYAALPLERGTELLGYFVIDFRAATLINDCFHERIRSEFDFTIEDGGVPLFRFSPDTEPVAAGPRSLRASISFPVGNRSWRLTTVPRRQRAAWGGGIDLLVPLLGLLLSFGLGWLVYLQRRAAQRHAKLSRKVLVAQEEERARLSRELHDEVGQLLTALRLEMGWWQKRLAAQSDEEAKLFHNAASLVEKGADELRRICRGLRPPLLDDLGIVPAVELLVREMAERTGIDTRLDCELGTAVEQSVPAEVALCVYRVLQESLNNVSRHAAAHRVSVTLAAAGDRLELSVADDGVGLDPGKLASQQGCGLEGMRERASLVGGSLELLSKPNRGTRVLLRVPASGLAPAGGATRRVAAEESG